jgi:hypothetical protein
MSTLKAKVPNPLAVVSEERKAHARRELSRKTMTINKVDVESLPVQRAGRAPVSGSGSGSVVKNPLVRAGEVVSSRATEINVIDTAAVPRDNLSRVRL